MKKPAKEAILQAAIAEFANYGLNGARIDRIAQRAKANKRMIYYYYGPKKTLYKEVLNIVYAGIVEALKGGLTQCDCNGKNEAEKISDLWEVYFKYLSSHPEYVAMISWENLQRGRFSEDTQVERLTHPMLQQVTQLLDQSNLLPADLDMRHYFLSIIALAFFYFSNQYTLSMILGADLFLEDEEKKYVETMKKLILLPLNRIEKKSVNLLLTQDAQ